MKFTPLELRELGELRDVDMVVYDEDFDYDDASQGGDRQQQAGHGHRPRAAVVAQAPLGQQRRGRRHPVACTCTSTRSRSRSSPTTTAASRAFRWERTRPDGEGGVVGTGEIRELPIQAIYRAVGYFGSPLPGVPFDKRHGVIPNHEGQVLRNDSNERVPGVYATGWIKRGPVGPHRPHQVRRDGDRAPHHQRPGVVVAARAIPYEEAIPALLAERGVRVDRPRAAGTGSTSTRSRSAHRTSARASRSCRATRWSDLARRVEPALPSCEGVQAVGCRV